MAGSSISCDEPDQPLTLKSGSPDEIPGQKENFLKAEYLIHQVGAFERFQKIFMLIMQLQAFQAGLRFLVLTYAVLEPDFHCDDHSGNYTDNCDVIRNCGNYSYTLKHGFRSFAADWPDLVVSRCLSSVAYNPVLLMISVKEIVCSVIFLPAGMLCDIFGRKPMMVLGTLICSVGLLCAAFSTSISMFTVLFISYATGSLIAGSSFVSLLNEVTLSRYRLTMSISVSYFLCYFVAVLAAYVTRDWRSMHIASASLGFLLSAIYMFFCPESPRWLLTKRKYGRAAKSLNHIARINGMNVRFTERFLRKEFHEIRPKVSKNDCLAGLKGLLTMFTEVKLLKYILFLIWYYVIINAITSNFIINAGEMKLDPYSSIAMMGAFRVWTPFAIVALDLYYPKFNRRFFLITSLIAVNLPLIFSAACVVVSELNQESQSWSILAVDMGAMISTGMAKGLLFYAVRQVNIEVLPTVNRSALMASMHVLSKIGAALGPQVILLRNLWAPLHYIVAAGRLLVALAMAVKLVPETKDTPLPDTYTDVELVLKKRAAKEKK